MAAVLSASIADAIAVGDVAAARIAHEALGRLLGEGTGGDGADVIDLAGRRTPKR